LFTLSLEGRRFYGRSPTKPVSNKARLHVQYAVILSAAKDLNVMGGFRTEATPQKL
jgi:hypothetical protein